MPNTYRILTEAEADSIDGFEMADYSVIDSKAGKLLDGNYALPNGAITGELMRRGKMGELTSVLNWVGLPLRQVAEEEWDRTGWEL